MIKNKKKFFLIFCILIIIVIILSVMLVFKKSDKEKLIEYLNSNSYFTDYEGNGTRYYDFIVGNYYSYRENGTKSSDIQMNLINFDNYTYQYYYYVQKDVTGNEYTKYVSYDYKNDIAVVKTYNQNNSYSYFYNYKTGINKCYKTVDGISNYNDCSILEIEADKVLSIKNEFLKILEQANVSIERL